MVSVILLQGLAISSMAILTGYLGQTQSVGNILLVRTTVIIAVMLPLCWNEIPRLFSLSSRAVWMRAVFGACSIICLFWNLTSISPTIAASIASTSSVFVTVLAFLFLKERPNFVQWSGIILTVACSVMMRDPQISGVSVSAITIGLAGAFFGGASLVSLRVATNFGSAPLIVGLNSLVVLPICFTLDIDATSIISALFPLTGIGLLALLSQWSITKIYQYLPAIQSVVATRASIIITIIMEAAFLNRTFKPIEMLMISGIVGGAFLVTYGKFLLRYKGIQSVDKP